MLKFKSIDGEVNNMLKIINDSEESAYKKYFAYEALIYRLRTLADALDESKKLVFKVGVEQMHKKIEQS